MVKWRFVIHVTIDGFSRVVLYVYCVTDNTSRTVQSLFEEAVRQHGLPSRVRCDHRLENVGMATTMLQMRGSAITGSSVHNQRVERLHRDVTSGVLRGYIEQFEQLERYELLDSSSDVHLFALYFVFKSLLLNGTITALALKTTFPLFPGLEPGCSSTVFFLQSSSTWHPDRLQYH